MENSYVALLFLCLKSKRMSYKKVRGRKKEINREGIYKIKSLHDAVKGSGNLALDFVLKRRALLFSASIYGSGARLQLSHGSYELTASHSCVASSFPGKRLPVAASSSIREEPAQDCFRER